MLVCPLLAQENLAWQNAATQGAAVAMPSADAFIVGNPSAIEQPRRISGETGAAGIGSTQITPFALVAMPVGQESMIGFGFTEPKPGAFDQHQIDFTGTSRILSGTWLGMHGTLQKTPAHVNMELGLGGYHRISSAWRLGWNLQHLTESLDSSTCMQCAQRRFDLGAAWFLDAEEHFGVYMDVARNDMQLSAYKRIQPSAGIRAEFGSNKNLQLILGVQSSSLDTSKRINASAGIAFQQYFYSSLVSVKYALSGLGLSGSKGETPTHQVTLSLVWDAFADRIDPKPFVRSSLSTLSISGIDNLPHDLDFLMRVDENSGKLADWSLVIYSARKDLSPLQIVRRFQGTGMPPSSIHWPGDDVAGNPCAPGIYAYRLITKDAAGNQGWTEWQHVEIR